MSTKKFTTYCVEKGHMTFEHESTPASKNWESVHICPKCEFILNLSGIDMRTITTGIVDCSNCDWIGPVEIQVIEVTKGND